MESTGLRVGLVGTLLSWPEPRPPGDWEPTAVSRVQRHESESLTDFLMLRLSFSFLDLSSPARVVVCSRLGSVLVTHAALTLFFSFLSLFDPSLCWGCLEQAGVWEAAYLGFFFGLYL